MKKIISIVLAIMILLTFTPLCFADSGVSRASLAKMLVESSSYKDELKAKVKYSVFSDVSQTNVNAQAIYIASRQGWMKGYTDGSFRPNNNLKLEEVCCAVLKYKGFNSKELKGAFPDAYVEKAEELDYLKGISAKQGEYVTLTDCETLFHNAGIGEYETNGTYYGIFKSSRSTISADDASSQKQITLVCMDGVERTFTATNVATVYSVGDLISITVSGENVKVSSLRSSSISGQVGSNSIYSYIGDNIISSDITLLETDEYGNTTTLDIKDLKGMTLKESNVLFYTKNSAGEINGLILKDVSGELNEYAILTSVNINEATLNLSSSYSYILNGKAEQKQFTSIAYIVEEGGISLRKNLAGEIKSIKNIGSVKLDIDTLNSTSATSGISTYKVADNVQVYLRVGDTYNLTTIDAIKNSYYSNVIGYYDQSMLAKIRIIVCY